MIVINSAAYVNDDLRAEFGLLPPCFLPLGNKRLYRYQVESLKKNFPNEEIYISLPEEYVIGEFDKLFFEENAIKIIKSPYYLSQGESLSLILKELSIESNERLIINYGDTLFNTFRNDSLNYFYVSKNIGYYNRAPVEINNQKFSIGQNSPAVDNGELVISGFFCFNDISMLSQCLHNAGCNFLSAIECYYSKVTTQIVMTDDWYDFGHLNSFFTSRTSITTEREFNSLRIDNDCVRKKSSKKQKMLGEANWFINLPSELSIYIPRIFNVKEYDTYAEYTIEYLYNLPLSDMAVFCELPASCWINVFNSCQRFLDISREYSDKSRVLNASDKEEYNKLYLHKTMHRLSEFEKTTSLDLNKSITFNGVKYPSIKDIAYITSEFIKPVCEDDIIITHGDFCFSNILYDFRSQRIKLIDPRGINFYNELSIWGDIRYDLAKLNHSVIGRYDLIIAEHFSLAFDYGKNTINFKLFDDNFKNITDAYLKVFDSFKKLKYSSLEIDCITIHLFLSMLPLHSDSKIRQDAFIANVYRLYSNLELEVL
ncbi:hypothetical protein MA092_001819 [Salmonella enterica]|nr:hypothetical protein [Salmonella enterica]